jgi:hypothetical protein
MNYDVERAKKILRQEICSLVKLINFDTIFIEDEIKYHDSNKLIYHYVSQSTFENIVRKNAVWATNLAYMNDSQELKDGYKIFSSIINDKFSSLISYEKYSLKNHYNNQEYDFDIGDINFQSFFWEKIKNYFNLINDAISLKNEDDPIHTYASCFTKEGDQLSQWRGYGRNGFSIGFDPYELQQIVQVKKNNKKGVNRNNIEIKLYQVEYDKEKKMKKVKNLIDSIQKNYTTLIENKKINDIVKEMKEKYGSKPQLQQDVIDIISESIIGYYHLVFYKILSICKHNGFNEEKEVRLIYFPDNYLSDHINIRNSYIPYVIFETKDGGKLPIKEIIISPDYSGKINHVKTGVKLLLKSSGYSQLEIDAIKIYPSNIPFRS